MKQQQLTVSVNTEPEGLRHERTFQASPGRPGLFLRALMASGSSDSAATARRRAVPIMSYVGSNGSGKTLCMVADTLPSLDAGRTVYSTVPLYDSETGEPHRLYRPFTHWRQLLEAEHADFLMDEIVSVASSRESTSLHVEVQRRLNQLRKSDVVLRWTAPAWMRADKIIREVTQAVTECAGYLSDRDAVKESAGAGIALWAPRRLFRFRTFDMRQFDEWSAGKRDKLHPDVKQWFRGPGSRAFLSYNTYDAVETLAPYDPNLCEHCGLRKRQETCRGH